MASTNKTANYELSQYIGTDIPNPLTDYNGDMEKIDAALKANADVAGGAQTSVTELEAKVGNGTLETEAQNLTDAANELKGEVDSLGSRMGTAEQGLNSVNNSLATTNQALTNATNRISALETHDGIVDGEITALDGRVSALEQGGGGGGTGTIDTEMSDSSTHAVQNKVIKRYVDDMHDAMAANLGIARSGVIQTGETSVTFGFPAECYVENHTYIDVYFDPYNAAVVTNVTDELSAQDERYYVTVSIVARDSDTDVSVIIKNL